jgi:hypothetical protein
MRKKSNFVVTHAAFESAFASTSVQAFASVRKP